MKVSDLMLVEVEKHPRDMSPEEYAEDQRIKRMQFDKLIQKEKDLFQQNIKKGKLTYKLVRGITGKLAEEARQHKPISTAHRGLNYWMSGYPSESVERILKRYSLSLDSVYGREGGVLITTELQVLVQNNTILFPENWGMAGDSHEYNPFKSKVNLDEEQGYIVSKGPITNYTIVKDYNNESK